MALQGTAQHGAARRGAARHGFARHGTKCVIHAFADRLPSPFAAPSSLPTPWSQVDGDMITLLREQFKALDADKSGSLDASDIGLLTEACERIEQDPQLLHSGS